MNHKNLILVDENNFFFRCFWSQQLTVGFKRTEIPYAILRNTRYMIDSIRKYNGITDDTVIFVGDRGYKRRLTASKQAVNEKIINRTYKAKRRIENKLRKSVMSDIEIAEEQTKQEQLLLFDEIFAKTRFQRVSMPGEEADDIIASYVKKYKNEYNIFIVSSDCDHYQLLDNNVTVFNSHKTEFITKEKFMEEYGFEPKYWVDFCSITGDDGDTIIGINGIGKAKAKPFIQKYKTVEILLAELKAKDDGHKLYDEMKKYKSFEEFRLNVKQTTWTLMEAKIVFFEKLLGVAKYLKGMFSDIEIPEPKNQDSDEQTLELEFKELKFMTILKFVDYFVKSNVNENRIRRILKIAPKPFMIYVCDSCKKEYMLTNESEAEKCECGGNIIKKVQSFIEQTRFF